MVESWLGLSQPSRNWGLLRNAEIEMRINAIKGAKFARLAGI
jgi:hypothetical protein